MLCQHISIRLWRVSLASRTQITINESLIYFDFAIIYNYFNDIKKRYQTYQDVKDPERDSVSSMAAAAMLMMDALMMMIMMMMMMMMMKKKKQLRAHLLCIYLTSITLWLETSLLFNASTAPSSDVIRK